jgi:hypothetical protein
MLRGGACSGKPAGYSLRPGRSKMEPSRGNRLLQLTSPDRTVHRAGHTGRSQQATRRDLGRRRKRFPYRAVDPTEPAVSGS